MSPFLIFAFILTVLYIIYYAVIITQDVYKKKDQTNTEEVESFDVSQMNDEDKPIEVSEDEKGFTLKTSTGELIKAEETLPQESVPLNPLGTAQPNNVPINVPNENSNNPDEVTYEENNVRMTFISDENEISPEYSLQLDKNEFKQALLTKGKVHNLIKKIEVKRDEI